MTAGGPWVYFCQAGDGGPIKIGWTSGPPALRVSKLQTGNAYELRLLVAVPGSGADEQDLHHRFRALRMVGEWFQPGPDLLAFVAAVLACASCEAARSVSARLRGWEAKLLRRAWRVVRPGAMHDGVEANNGRFFLAAVMGLSSDHDPRFCGDVRALLATLWEAP